MRAAWRLAAGLGAVLLAGCGGQAELAAPDAAGGESAAAVTTSTTSSSTSASTPAASAAFSAADASGAQVALYDSPDAPAPRAVLPNPTVEGVPLTLGVRGMGPPGWVHVAVNQRPNGSTAWVRADELSLRRVENRILVELGARRLSLFEGWSDRKLFEAPVAIGTASTPTPLGNFYVDVVVKITDKPDGVYGPYQLSVSGFSDVLTAFAGGTGQIAIHGTNRPDLIGQAVSNGCVRLANDQLRRLVDLAPSGTPVEIRA
jgi:lipoprotein-anchoring transpeptidase ErfK/SrfK